MSKKLLPTKCANSLCLAISKKPRRFLVSRHGWKCYGDHYVCPDCVNKDWVPRNRIVEVTDLGFSMPRPPSQPSQPRPPVSPDPPREPAQVESVIPAPKIEQEEKRKPRPLGRIASFQAVALAAFATIRTGERD